MSPHPYGFSFEPIFLVLAALAAVAYLRASRTDRPGKLRAAVFAAGLLLLVGPVNSPLETLAAHYLLLAHLLQNAMIADWAPPLVILGLTPAMRGRVAQFGGRSLRLLTEPRHALPIWLVGWYAVHLPFFYDWALREQWPLNLEHGILIAIGFLFWWPLFESEPRRLTVALALVYLGIAFVGSPWLALAYIFSTHPFYEFYEHAQRLWSLSPTKDQNLGGVLMQGEQMLVFLVVMSYFFIRLLAEEEEKQRALDERDAAMLRSLAPPGAGPSAGS